MKTSTSSIVLNDITAQHIRDFSARKSEPAWVLALRLKAFEASTALIWPTPNDEKWKRSELSLFSFDKFSWANEATPITKDAWKSFEESLASESDLIRQTWTKAIDQAAGNKFLLLTLALANEGSVLRIPKNTTGQIARFPQISIESGSAHFTFNIVIVEDGSDLQLWEETSEAPMNGDGKSLGFLGSYTALILKNNAQASHYGLQNWNDRVLHFQFQDTYQERDSHLHAIAVQMGGRVHRNQLAIHLEGVGAENKILGVLFGEGSQNFENWITQNHLDKKTISDIQYRGALKGSAHSFFSGLVSIVKAAQQSDAFQSSKSLLLSKEARADAIPNLEILADDVKCAHGAAVGQVDEDQKFYLQTRGVPPADAERIIIEGFFEPVIAEVPSEPTRERLRLFVEEKLNRS